MYANCTNGCIVADEKLYTHGTRTKANRSTAGAAQARVLKGKDLFRKNSKQNAQKCTNDMIVNESSLHNVGKRELQTDNRRVCYRGIALHVLKPHTCSTVAQYRLPHKKVDTRNAHMRDRGLLEEKAYLNSGNPVLTGSRPASGCSASRSTLPLSCCACARISKRGRAAASWRNLRK